MEPQVITSDLWRSLEQLSAQFGTGHLLTDVVVMLIALSVLSLLIGLVGLLRPRRQPTGFPAGMERLSSLGGKFERLDMSVSGYRTEALRAVELLRSEVERLRAEVDALRRGAPVPPSEPAKAAPEVRAPVTEPSTPEIVEAPPAPTEAVAVAAPEPLTARLSKTRTSLFGKLRSLFALRPKIDQESIDELEELLVSSDVGVKTSAKLLQEVKQEVSNGKELSEDSLIGLLKIKVLGILEQDAALDPSVKPRKRANGEPTVVMVVGVNGVGKTTTVAKLAAQWKEQGASVLMVAGDTFRAAAVDQLSTWGERIGVPVVAGEPNAKPATVVFDGMKAAKEQGVDVVLIDTAGRLHNKSNLMQELEGVRNSIERHVPGAPHEVLLVVDGSTGQNAISQAREFNESVKLTGLVVTKLDGTPKGGIVIAIKDELGIPVRYIGVGESQHDIRPFAPREFTDALFDPAGTEGGGGDVPLSAHGEVRRRRRRETQPIV